MRGWISGCCWLACWLLAFFLGGIGEEIIDHVNAKLKVCERVLEPGRLPPPHPVPVRYLLSFVGYQLVSVCRRALSLLAAVADAAREFIELVAH